MATKMDLGELITMEDMLAVEDFRDIQQDERAGKRQPAYFLMGNSCVFLLKGNSF